MVAREEMISAVKSMLSSGFSDPDIVSTLKDFQLSDSEIQSLLSEARGKAVSSGDSSASAGDLHPVAAQAVGVVQEQLAAHAEEQAVRQGMVQESLEEHRAALNQVDQKVADVHTTVASVHSSVTAGEMDLANIKRKLSVLEEQSTQSKAEILAIKTIMQKVLESQRKILDKLD